MVRDVAVRPRGGLRGQRAAAQERARLGRRVAAEQIERSREHPDRERVVGGRQQRHVAEARCGPRPGTAARPAGGPARGRHARPHASRLDRRAHCPSRSRTARSEAARAAGSSPRSTCWSPSGGRGGRRRCAAARPPSAPRARSKTGCAPKRSRARLYAETTASWWKTWVDGLRAALSSENSSARRPLSASAGVAGPGRGEEQGVAHHRVAVVVALVARVADEDVVAEAPVGLLEPGPRRGDFVSLLTPRGRCRGRSWRGGHSQQRCDGHRGVFTARRCAGAR